MAKTPDNFLRPPINQIPIEDSDLYIRLERDSLRYYTDNTCETLHRMSGPAVLFDNGTIEYWNQGQLHNISGPSVETALGMQVYYLFGRRLTYEKWLDLKKKYSLDKVSETSVIKVHENNGETRSTD